MTDLQDSAFYVVGVATRTDNQTESDPATARLPGLWQRAVDDAYLAERRAVDHAGLVAVLTDYAGDDTGAYTQVVGVRTDDLTSVPERLVAVAVPTQPRRHVQAHGAMPDALIAAWQIIWKQTTDGTISRAYRTDYELHGTNGADIYLSVNDVE